MKYFVIACLFSLTACNNPTELDCASVKPGAFKVTYKTEKSSDKQCPDIDPEVVVIPNSLQKKNCETVGKYVSEDQCSATTTVICDDGNIGATESLEIESENTIAGTVIVDYVSEGVTCNYSWSAQRQ